MEIVVRSENRRYLHAPARRLFFSLIFFCFFAPSVMSQGAAFQNVKITEIKKLEMCDLPGEMVARIKNLLPQQMSQFKEEYQETVQDESGEQLVKTIHLRFVDDHIMGYIKTAPLQNTGNAVINNVQIKVPLLWGCVPGVGHAQQHTAWSLAEMNELSATQSCANWHQMRDGEHLIPPMPKPKRKKFLGMF